MKKEASTFPETSVTLLGKLAAQVTGEDEANWLRFWNLYHGAIRRFIKRVGGSDDNADEVVSEVMRKLVDFFRAGRLDREKGNFRSYLARMIRNELGMIYRREKVRGEGRFVYLDMDNTEDDDRSFESAQVEAAQAEISRPGDDVWQRLDLEFAAAKRQEALEHVFANPAISQQKKDVYRAYVLEERPIAEVAERFGITRNLVSQIKVRMEKTLMAVLAELGFEA